MDLRIFTEPQQGATYEQLLGVARSAERLGFDAFFRSDHYLAMGSSDGLPGPSDAWITLAGLARDTETIRLGTLVTPTTFRQPGPLAIAAANVDLMSGGRLELGLGAGWYEAEHTAYGMPFPPMAERFDRFAEQLEIIHGMWTTPPGQTYSFTGSYYTLIDAPALPKPEQTPPPIVLGGAGKTRSAALAARFAAEYNVGFVSADTSAEIIARVSAAAERTGRHLIYSVAQVACVAGDAAVLAERASAIGRDLDELRENGLAGTPDEVRTKLRRFAAVGISRVYLQVLDLDDLAHLQVLAELIDD